MYVMGFVYQIDGGDEDRFYWILRLPNFIGRPFNRFCSDYGRMRREEINRDKRKLQQRKQFNSSEYTHVHINYYDMHDMTISYHDF